MVTTQNILDIIENEGIGYAVQNYYRNEEFENETLKSLWINAGNALDDLDSVEKIKDNGSIVTTILRFDDDDYIMVFKSNIPKELIENIEYLYEEEDFDLNMKFYQLAKDNGYFFEEVQTQTVIA